MEQRLINVFSRIARGSARVVVLASNPVHSVLSLVLAFVNVCGLMLLLQVEFIALIFRVVYVGAIAVLFLFVIMILNLGTVSKENHLEQSVVSILGRLFQVERALLLSHEVGLVDSTGLLSRGEYVTQIKRMDGRNTIETLGQVLYTHYFMYVIIAGFVLLVAMIGAIVLTLSVRTFARAKRQQVQQQRSRDIENAVMRVRLEKDKSKERQ